MATELLVPAFIRPGDAAADLTGKQGYAAVLNTSGQWALAGANAAGLRGIIVEGVAAGFGASVAVLGKARAVAGGNFNPGVSVTTDANGKVVLATTGQNAIGYSWVGGAAGKVVSVEVRPHVAP